MRATEPPWTLTRTSPNLARRVRTDPRRKEGPTPPRPPRAGDRGARPASGRAPTTRREVLLAVISAFPFPLTGEPKKFRDTQPMRPEWLVSPARPRRRGACCFGRRAAARWWWRPGGTAARSAKTAASRAASRRRSPRSRDAARRRRGRLLFRTACSTSPTPRTTCWTRSPGTACPCTTARRRCARLGRTLRRSPRDGGVPGGGRGDANTNALPAPLPVYDADAAGIRNARRGGGRSSGTAFCSSPRTARTSWRHARRRCGKTRGARGSF